MGHEFPSRNPGFKRRDNAFLRDSRAAAVSGVEEYGKPVRKDYVANGGRRALRGAVSNRCRINQMYFR